MTIASGLLVGSVGGTALVLAGVLGPRSSGQASTSVALLSCPGSGEVLARVPAGQAMLITGRSADGGWLQVYVGEPGVDRAWAPAGSLRLESAVDQLPVDACAAQVAIAASLPAPSFAIQTGSPSPSPEVVASQSGAPNATPSPTPTPRGGATPTPTPATHATPTPTPTPTPGPGATPTPTPSPTPTPTPIPTPTPTPTPVPDTTAPSISNTTSAQVFGGNCSSTASFSVNATDPDDAVAGVTLYYWRPGTFGNPAILPTPVDMTHQSGSVWKATITWSASWNDGPVNYYFKAHDTHGNSSQTGFYDNVDAESGCIP